LKLLKSIELFKQRNKKAVSSIYKFFSCRKTFNKFNTLTPSFEISTKLKNFNLKKSSEKMRKLSRNSIKTFKALSNSCNQQKVLINKRLVIYRLSLMLHRTQPSELRLKLRANKIC
jgi:hypothetical protein